MPILGGSALQAAVWQNSQQVVAAAAAPELQQFWQQVTQGQLTSQLDELTLAYAYSIPANAKAAVILIQGRTESYLKYQQIFWLLHQAGFAVFSLDHRGQGLSARMLADPQRGHVWSFNDYVADQQQFITELVQPKLTDLLITAGNTAQSSVPLLMLAHSMGGAVGALLLVQQPQQFKAAVLLAPMIRPNTTLAWNETDGCDLATLFSWSCPDCYAGFVAAPYQALPFSQNQLTHSAVHYQQMLELAQQYPKTQLGGPTWQWLGEACAVADTMPSIAAKIKTPFLLLQAGADQIVSTAAQAEFCHVAAPYCESGKVGVITGAKHELLFEAEPYRSQSIQQLLEYLNRQLISQ